MHINMNFFVNWKNIMDILDFEWNETKRPESCWSNGDGQEQCWIKWVFTPHELFANENVNITLQSKTLTKKTAKSCRFHCDLIVKSVSDCYVADEIITSRAGVRVRVGNTDAEGRMAMADVLCHMKEQVQLPYLVCYSCVTHTCTLSSQGFHLIENLHFTGVLSLL